MLAENVSLGHEADLVNVVGAKEVVFCPPKSTTKGRPRKRRIKGGKELQKKKIKKCSACHMSGHTKPTCPGKENVELSSERPSKRKKSSASASDLGLNPVYTIKY